MSIGTRAMQYGSLFGTWKIREFIGEGSQGKTGVFRMIKNYKDHREENALKVVTVIRADGWPEEMTDRARREFEDDKDVLCAQALNEVKLMNRLVGDSYVVHYNNWDFCDWEESGQFGCDLLIQMPMLKTLKRLQGMEEYFSEEEIRRVGQDICRALIHCGEADIIHRDIKPANIFIWPDRKGNYMLGDFGVSRIVENGLRGDYTSIGTKCYAAPEQFAAPGQSDASYDSRVDIYSLGLTLYELANQNRLPFWKPGQGNSEKAVWQRRSGSELPPPSQASPALAKVILKACAFCPEDRFKTAEEFLHALQNLQTAQHGRTAELPASDVTSESELDPDATVPLVSFVQEDSIAAQKTIGEDINQEKIAVVGTEHESQPDYGEHTETDLSMKIGNILTQWKNKLRETDQELFWNVTTDLFEDAAFFVDSEGRIFYKSIFTGHNVCDILTITAYRGTGEDDSNIKLIFSNEDSITVGSHNSCNIVCLELKKESKLKAIIDEKEITDFWRNTYNQSLFPHQSIETDDDAISVWNYCCRHAKLVPYKNSFKIKAGRLCIRGEITPYVTSDIVEMKYYSVTHLDDRYCREIKIVLNDERWIEFYEDDTRDFEANIYPVIRSEPREMPSQQPAHRTNNVLMGDSFSLSTVSYNVFPPVFGSAYRRDQISTITFLDSLAGLPYDAWDVSEVRDGSVMAWVKPNGKLFDLYIGANSGITAPGDCSCLFAGYERVSAIHFNGIFDTSKATDMKGMFAFCEALESLDVSGFDTANVRKMQEMFFCCKAMKSLDLSKLDTTSVMDMRYMFKGCSSLTVLDVSGFDTAKVTNMNGMFYECKSLTALDVSGFDTAKVTSMMCMFAGCSNLKALDVSGFDTSNVGFDASKHVGFDIFGMGFMFRMFEGCSSLMVLDVSGFDTTKVTSMYAMFKGCSSLTTLDVSGFNTTNVADMREMFNGCSSLIALDVSKLDTTSVTDMQEMFEDCSSLTVLDVSGFDTAKVTNMMCMFRGCSNLTALDVSSFNTSNVANTRCMFDGCSSLMALDMSKFDTAKVTDMLGMFRGCKSLTALDVNSFDTANVTGMWEMFKDCSSLQTLNVSSFNTAKVTRMRGMFEGCSSLIVLNLSSFEIIKVTNFDRLFRRKIIDMRFMFRGCENLTVLHVKNWNTSNADTEEMFDGCPLPTEVISSILSGKVVST